MSNTIISTKDAPADSRRTLTPEGRVQNALDRAEASTRKVWQIGPHAYKIHSFTDASPQAWYQLAVTHTGIVCNCLAGKSKQVCKHGVKLALKLRREGKPAVYAPVDFYEGELFDELPATPASWQTARTAKPTRLERMFE